MTTVDRAAAPTPTLRELRGFAWTVGGAFLVLAVALWWRGRTTIAVPPAALGLSLVLAGVAVPGRLAPVQRAWMRIAVAISRVTTPILMGAIYYGVLTPIGLALRLAGRDPLARSRGVATYWVERPPGRRRSDLRRQF